MNRIHNRLCALSPWYDRWHKDKLANQVTWMLFFVVALMYATGILSIISTENSMVQGANQASLAIKALERAPKQENSEAVERLSQVSNSALSRVSEHAKRPSSQAFATLREALEIRKSTLMELALTDPKEARRFVFDRLALQSIPEGARDLVEKPFEKQGIYHIALVSEEFVFGEGEVSHEEYLLEVSPTEIYRLALTEDEAYKLTPEEKLTVSGFEIEDDIIIPTGEQIQEDDGGRVLGATVTKKLAVIAFNFQNDTSQPLTVDQIRGRIFSDPSSMTALYKEMSYGQMVVQGRDRIDGDVYDWVTIPANGGDCAYNNWSSLANKALTDKGISLTGYTNFQYIFPGSASGCGWAGLAYMPGSTSWVLANYTGAGISGHEFGHNVGFHHASSYGCSVGTNAVGVCSPSEYGDDNDLMGGGSARHTNNYNKARFWLDPAQIVTASQSGTFTLEPTETAGTGVKLVRIKRPFATGSYMNTNGYYHLEYRTPTGFDSYIGASTLLIRLVSDYATGGSSKTYSVTSVPIGQTFTDAEAGITIRPTNAAATGVTVEIQLTVAPCKRSNPTVSISPDGQWGSAGASLGYTAFVQNNDSETCGQSTYTLTSSLPTGFTQGPAALSVSLNPFEQKSVAFTVTAPSTAVPATYTFTELVENTGVPTSSASAGANFNVTPPDVTAPTVSITSPANGAVLKGAKVSLSASASDTSGIARIELSVDGIVVKTCSAATTCTYSWNTRRVSSGTHTVRAVATDNSSQQNRSEASITVTK